MNSRLQSLERLAERSANEPKAPPAKVSERVMHTLARKLHTHAAVQQRALLVGGLALCVAGIAVLVFLSRTALDDYLPLFIPHDHPPL